MNHRELIESISNKLKSCEDVDNPELEARWIVERAKEDQSFIEAATKKRKTGYPLAYVLGEKDFYGITYMVNENVLIPRPESEHIVDAALSWIKAENIKNPKLIDLGAGTGCLGLSILKNCESATLCSVETSVDACDVIDFNAKALGLDDRTEIWTMDVEVLEPANYDIIIANPPYIDEKDSDLAENVRAYEPKLALFSDEQGFGALRRWSERAKNLMADKALVLFEIGTTQGPKSLEIFNYLNCFDELKIIKDFAGHDRVIKAVRR